MIQSVSILILAIVYAWHEFDHYRRRRGDG